VGKGKNNNLICFYFSLSHPLTMKNKQENRVFYFPIFHREGVGRLAYPQLPSFLFVIASSSTKEKKGKGSCDKAREAPGDHQGINLSAFKIPWTFPDRR